MIIFPKMIAPVLAAAVFIGLAGSASAADNFRMTPNAGIPGSNQETHRNVSVQSCLALCNQRPWCKSADYERAAATCFLQPVNAAQKPLRTTYPGNPYDHYHKLEATAPAAVTPPVGTASPEETCYRRVISKDPSWLPGGVIVVGSWTDQNARRLCRDTPTAKHTVDCFSSAIKLGADFNSAMQWCEYRFSACAHAQYDALRDWEAALRRCHIGSGQTAHGVGNQAQNCLRSAAEAGLDQSQAHRLCGSRSLKLPADCYETLRPVVKDTELTVMLCRNSLHPQIALACFNAGNGNYPQPLSHGQAATIVEICRMQDNQVDFVNQRSDSFAQGMRDSCVQRRALNSQTGQLDLGHGWRACAGQRLY